MMEWGNEGILPTAATAAALADEASAIATAISAAEKSNRTRTIPDGNSTHTGDRDDTSSSNNFPEKKELFCPEREVVEPTVQHGNRDQRVDRNSTVTEVRTAPFPEGERGGMQYPTYAQEIILSRDHLGRHLLYRFRRCHLLLRESNVRLLELTSLKNEVVREEESRRRSTVDTVTRGASTLSNLPDYLRNYDHDFGFHYPREHYDPPSRIHERSSQRGLNRYHTIMDDLARERSRAARLSEELPRLLAEITHVASRIVDKERMTGRAWSIAHTDHSYPLEEQQEYFNLKNPVQDNSYRWKDLSSSASSAASYFPDDFHRTRSFYRRPRAAALSHALKREQQKWRQRDPWGQLPPPNSSVIPPDRPFRRRLPHFPAHVDDYYRVIRNIHAARYAGHHLPAWLDGIVSPSQQVDPKSRVRKKEPSSKRDHHDEVAEGVQVGGDGGGRKKTEVSEESRVVREVSAGERNRPDGLPLARGKESTEYATARPIYRDCDQSPDTTIFSDYPHLLPLDPPLPPAPLISHSHELYIGALARGDAFDEAIATAASREGDGERGGREGTGGRLQLLRLVQLRRALEERRRVRSWKAREAEVRFQRVALDMQVN